MNWNKDINPSRTDVVDCLNVRYNIFFFASCSMVAHLKQIPISFKINSLLNINLWPQRFEILNIFLVVKSIDINRSNLIWIFDWSNVLGIQVTFLTNLCHSFIGYALNRNWKFLEICSINPYVMPVQISPPFFNYLNLS